MTLDSTADPARPPSASTRSAGSVRGRRIVAVLAAFFLVAGVAAPAAAQTPEAPPSDVPAAAPSSGADSEISGSGPLVVLGIGGLTWADISPATTPHVWKLAEKSAKGNLSLRTVRSTSCAIDGWLTLGAGRRAGTALPDETAVRCPAMPTITPDGASGAPGPATVSGFSAYRAFNKKQAYMARPGDLARAVARDGAAKGSPGNKSGDTSGGKSRAVCTVAIGPGAATALADPSGDVRRYLPAGTVPASHGHRLGSCPLTMVDLGSVGDSSWLKNADTTSRADDDTDADNTVPDAAELQNNSERDKLSAAVRATQLRDADELLGKYLRAIPDNATIMLLGPSDSSYSPQLGAIMVSGPGNHGGLLTSQSTRRHGLMQMTDVAPTILNLIGDSRYPRFVGTPAAHVAAAQSGAASTDDEVASLRESALEASLVHDSVGAFSIGLDIAFYLFFILLALGLYVAGRKPARRAAAGSPRRARAVAWTALALGSVPTATFVANLAPWARGPHPLVLLFASIIVAAAVVFGAVLIRPWGRTWLGRVGALGAITALVLGVDVATGSHLQLNSMLGYNAIVGGRFYGLGNLAVALYAVGALMGTAAIVSPLVRARRRRTATVVAAIIGIAAIAVIGNPAWGAKFGGTIALLAGFLVLVLLLAGVTMSVRRLVVVAVIALAVLFAVAGLDYLRPPAARSHFGLFFQQVLSGDVADVIARKLEANLSILIINPLLSIILPVGLVVIGLVLGWARRWRRTGTWVGRFAGRLPEASRRRPALALGLGATVMALAVGLVITDSGAAVPATGFMLLIPMLVAASADVADVPAGGTVDAGADAAGDTSGHEAADGTAARSDGGRAP